MSLSDLCPACGTKARHLLTSATGQRAYCDACFHGWRTQIDPFSYSATAMCSLGTSTDRLASQIAFFAPYCPPDARILEIGCATGELAAATRAALSPAVYEGIELSPAGDQARQIVSRLHTEPLPRLLSAGAIDPPFQLILMSHVLEHIEDPEAELRAMRSVLGQGGTMFIEVPNGAGHRNLPIDDNRSHLHFFSATSLARMLAKLGLEVIATQTDARLDTRYADSLRVVARAFSPPQPSPTLLSDHGLLAGEDRIVVWGAGSLVDEMLANFFSPDRIDYFIDKDPAKQGGSALGRPVRAPGDLGRSPRTILLNSIDFAPAIARDIAALYPDTPHRLIPIGDLLTPQG